jgi:hypothetical protein
MSARAAGGRKGDPAAQECRACGHDAARLLALLRQDRNGAVSVAAMREQGIKAPAQAIYTLQLAGYVIDRVPADAHGRRSPAYRLRGGQHTDGGFR